MRKQEVADLQSVCKNHNQIATTAFLSTLNTGHLTDYLFYLGSETMPVGGLGVSDYNETLRVAITFMAYGAPVTRDDGLGYGHRNVVTSPGLLVLVSQSIVSYFK